MSDPSYQPDVEGMAEELTQRHGMQALDVAVDTVKQHMQASKWKHCAMWLQVVNRLNAVPVEARAH